MWRFLSASVDLLVFIIWTHLKFLILFEQFTAWTAKHRVVCFQDLKLLFFRPIIVSIHLLKTSFSWPLPWLLSWDVTQPRSQGGQQSWEGGWSFERVFDNLALPKLFFFFNSIRECLWQILESCDFVGICYKLINLIRMGKFLCKVQDGSTLNLLEDGKNTFVADSKRWIHFY